MFFAKTDHRLQDKVPAAAPAVSIYEKDQELILEFEMPGVDKDTLDVQLLGKQITVRGKVKEDNLGKSYSLIYRERFPLEYTRSFELNAEVDQARVSASYEGGVLQVHLPLNQAALPRKIDIQ